MNTRNIIHKLILIFLVTFSTYCYSSEDLICIWEYNCLLGETNFLANYRIEEKYLINYRNRVTKEGGILLVVEESRFINIPRPGNATESELTIAKDYQFNKSTELKQVENSFLTICGQLNNGNLNKLSFEELNIILTNLQESDPNTAILVSLRLLSINASGVKYGGVDWWDTCQWHPEIE